MYHPKPPKFPNMQSPTSPTIPTKLTKKMENLWTCSNRQKKCQTVSSRLPSLLKNTQLPTCVTLMRIHHTSPNSPKENKQWGQGRLWAKHGTELYQIHLFFGTILAQWRVFWQSSQGFFIMEPSHQAASPLAAAFSNLGEKKLVGRVRGCPERLRR